MRDFARLGDHVAGLVQDRHGAVRRVLVDLAVDDVDDRRPVAVAVPGYDAAGLDGQLAHAELAVLDVGRLLFHVDHGNDGVGDADRLVVDWGRGVGFLLVSRAFAGECGRGDKARAQNDAGKNEATAETAAICESRHVRLTPLASASAERNGRGDSTEDRTKPASTGMP